MEYKKNDLLTVTIEDMGHDGEGIGKVDGYTVFVKDAVIGDTVSAKIMKAKKNYGYARLMEILEPSADRVEPLCPYARQCGGCQIQALSYEKQLEYKENKIRNNLMRIGGFTSEELPMEPIIGMDDPFHYRNKAQFPVGYDKEGNLITGFYAGRTHSIISNRRCYLGVEINEKILDIVLKHMEKYQITAYDENTGIWWYSKNQSSWAKDFVNILGSVRVESGKITKFQVDTVDSVVNSNASNFSQAGRSYLSGLSMPSSRYIDLTLGASGSTYTAPANGWFAVSKNALDVNQYLQIAGLAFLQTMYAVTAGARLDVCRPVRKGESVNIPYNASGTTNYFRFIYAEGEN